MKQNNKDGLVPVCLLRPGERFEIPPLNDTMKNLKFISSSECSSLIEGQTRQLPSEPWKPFSYHISNSVRVRPLTKEFMNIENNTIEPQNTKDTSIKKKRGRPSKESLSIDTLNGVQNVDFTIKDVLNNNSVKIHDLYKLFKEEIASGKLKVVKEISTGRGKPAKVYRFVK
jgi:hypothetical protein